MAIGPLAQAACVNQAGMGTSFATQLQHPPAHAGLSVLVAFTLRGKFALATPSTPRSRRSLSQTSCTAASALVLLSLLAAGCHRRRKTTSAPNTTQYAGNIQAVVAKKDLPGLRWPDYSDYQPLVATFYDDRNSEIAWIRDLKPTAETTAFIQAFTDAGAKGLSPEDYDASRWPARLQQIAQVASTHDTSSAAQDAVAQFDTFMTVCVMRYISDLRIGRVNPTHFNFDINVQEKKYDLAEFVSDNAVDARDVPALMRSVEPDSDQYRATEAALARYLTLAQMQAAAAAPLLPEVAKSGVSPGESYPETGLLLARLQLEGDAPGAYPLELTPPPAPQSTPKPATRAHKLFHRSAPVAQKPTATPASGPVLNFNPPDLPPVYTAALADAVKLYQHRHGLTEDGKLTSETIKNLNVPLTERVIQLQDSLERWRWLPAEYINAPLIVNLPEFILRGYNPDHKVAFTMKVVVGKVLGDHDTPVFAHIMRYLIFRPYWNVPVDIARKEIAPHMQSNPGYLGAKSFEATDNQGNLVPATASQVAEGRVLVREKPGPKNSLGLVKFMFPNEYNIYLHSTPAPELFERTRRDFSHGCIRVQKPEDLAVWVLNTSATPGPVDGAWDLAHVHEAMTTGPDNRQINLKNSIPIVIFYVTAIAAEDGHTHFFDDLYNYDQKLQQVLAKGPPYPMQPDPHTPKPSPADTL
jgi:L,D-transpeptidase YcbB